MSDGANESKINRRSFITGLGLLLGGCATGTVKPLSVGRAPTGAKSSANALLLASDPASLKDEYEAVVIGSGYGASVIAARLTGHFKNLCILERGREWKPGEFPTNPLQLSNAVRSLVNPAGLLDISGNIGSDMDIICASGLGGTSLINAAIAIRPEKSVFAEKEWPPEIQQDARTGRLEKYYALAESVLKPNVLIRNGQTPKSTLHRQLVEKVGRKWGELSLNIRQTDSAPGPNEYGYPQAPCVECGDCCSGCNYGAKNTLVTNYLALARSKGAQIFTQVEVVSIEKTHKGYKLHVLRYSPEGSERAVIRAKYVFLGAGSKGSTEILLKSQGSDFQFSHALGTRLSANGDVVGLAYNTEHRTDILARAGDPKLTLSNAPGTIIASYADYRNPSPGGDVNSQFLLLDGVVPSSMRDLLGKAMASYALTQFQNLSNTQRERALRDLNGINVDPEGALNHSMLYFACGHDSSSGRFEYSKLTGLTAYKWKNALQEKTFRRINSTMKAYSQRLGGMFIPNPRSTVFGQRIQATHPLGGCPMGTDHLMGTVDHMGRVFNAGGGHHEGLYVVDAAIIPRSLAATPLLTITALAERIAEDILKN